MAVLLVFALREPRKTERVSRLESEGESSLPILPHRSPSQTGEQRVVDGAESARLADSAAIDPGRPIAQLIEVERLHSDEDHDHPVEVWAGTLSLPIRDWQDLEPDDAGRIVVPLEFPDGARYSIQLDAVEQIAASKGLYMASVVGRPLASASFGFVNAASSGVVRLPSEGKAWEFRVGPDGRQLVELVRLADMGRCGGCRVRTR